MAAVAAPGLTVMAIILFMGAISVEPDQRRLDEPGAADSASTTSHGRK